MYATLSSPRESMEHLHLSPRPEGDLPPPQSHFILSQSVHGTPSPVSQTRGRPAPTTVPLYPLPESPWNTFTCLPDQRETCPHHSPTLSSPRESMEHLHLSPRPEGDLPPPQSHFILSQRVHGTPSPVSQTRGRPAPTTVPLYPLPESPWNTFTCLPDQRETCPHHSPTLSSPRESMEHLHLSPRPEGDLPPPQSHFILSQRVHGTPSPVSQTRGRTAPTTVPLYPLPESPWNTFTCLPDQRETCPTTVPLYPLPECPWNTFTCLPDQRETCPHHSPTLSSPRESMEHLHLSPRPEGDLPPPQSHFILSQRVHGTPSPVSQTRGRPAPTTVPLYPQPECPWNTFTCLPDQRETCPHHSPTLSSPRESMEHLHLSPRPEGELPPPQSHFILSQRVHGTPSPVSQTRGRPAPTTVPLYPQPECPWNTFTCLPDQRETCPHHSPTLSSPRVSMEHLHLSPRPEGDLPPPQFHFILSQSVHGTPSPVSQTRGRTAPTTVPLYPLPECPWNTFTCLPDQRETCPHHSPTLSSARESMEHLHLSPRPEGELPPPQSHFILSQRVHGTPSPVSQTRGRTAPPQSHFILSQRVHGTPSPVSQTRGRPAPTTVPLYPLPESPWNTFTCLPDQRETCPHHSPTLSSPRESMEHLHLSPRPEGDLPHHSPTLSSPRESMEHLHLSPRPEGDLPPPQSHFILSQRVHGTPSPVSQTRGRPAPTTVPLYPLPESPWNTFTCLPDQRETCPHHSPTLSSPRESMEHLHLSPRPEGDLPPPQSHFILSQRVHGTPSPVSQTRGRPAPTTVPLYPQPECPWNTFTCLPDQRETCPHHSPTLSSPRESMEHLHLSPRPEGELPPPQSHFILSQRVHGTPSPVSQTRGRPAPTTVPLYPQPECPWNTFTCLPDQRETCPHHSPTLSSPRVSMEHLHLSPRPEGDLPPPQFHFILSQSVHGTPSPVSQTRGRTAPTTVPLYPLPECPWNTFTCLPDQRETCPHHSPTLSSARESMEHLHLSPRPEGELPPPQSHFILSQRVHGTPSPVSQTRGRTAPPQSHFILSQRVHGTPSPVSQTRGRPAPTTVPLYPLPESPWNTFTCLPDQRETCPHHSPTLSSPRESMEHLHLSPRPEGDLPHHSPTLSSPRESMEHLHLSPRPEGDLPPPQSHFILSQRVHGTPSPVSQTRGRPAPTTVPLYPLPESPWNTFTCLPDQRETCPHHSPTLSSPRESMEHLHLSPRPEGDLPPPQSHFILSQRVHGTPSPVSQTRGRPAPTTVPLYPQPECPWNTFTCLPDQRETCPHHSPTLSSARESMEHLHLSPRPEGDLPPPQSHFILSQSVHGTPSPVSQTRGRPAPTTVPLYPQPECPWNTFTCLPD